uniref:Mitochondrial import inner membrane translocase subunit tim-16 n=1 Tax=Meloidogyne javanica TaxID=6303 RepID=A0A915LTV2_MELJA
MVWKALARVAAAGAGAVFTALKRAISEELNATRQAAARQPTAESPNVSNARQRRNGIIETDLRMGISTQEAMQILGIKPPPNEEEVKRRYEHLFSANEKSKGGTLYLQAKIYRAKERLDVELMRIAKENAEKTGQKSETD